MIGISILNWPVHIQTSPIRMSSKNGIGFVFVADGKREGTADSAGGKCHAPKPIGTASSGADVVCKDDPDLGICPAAPGEHDLAFTLKCHVRR